LLKEFKSYNPSILKIIAIGRNYADHAKELKNTVPSSPVIFLKPDTALLKSGEPFYLPDFDSEIHYETELVIKISKEGKHIEEKFASRYYEEISLGLDLTARDLQTRLKEKGLPWELAKAFDASAPMGQFIPKSTFENIQDIPFSMKLNGKLAQSGNSSSMIFSVDYLISFISKRITLKKGDLIMTGTPEGVGPIHIGDILEAYLGEELVLRTEVK